MEREFLFAFGLICLCCCGWNEMLGSWWTEVVHIFSHFGTPRKVVCGSCLWRRCPIWQRLILRVHLLSCLIVVFVAIAFVLPAGIAESGSDSKATAAAFLREALNDPESAGLALFLDGQMPVKLPLKRVKGVHGQSYYVTPLALGRAIEKIPAEEIEAAGILRNLGGHWVRMPLEGQSKQTSLEFYNLGQKDTLIVLPKDTQYLCSRCSSTLPVVMRPSSTFLRLYLNFLDEYGYINLSGLGYMPLNKEMMDEFTSDRGKRILVVRSTGLFDAVNGGIACIPAVKKSILIEWGIPNAPTTYVRRDGVLIEDGELVLGVKTRRPSKYIEALEENIACIQKSGSYLDEYVVNSGDLFGGNNGLRSECKYWRERSINADSPYIEVMLFLSCLK